MKRNKKIYMALGVMVIIVAIVLFFIKEVIEVKVVKVQRGQIIQTVQETGYVRPIAAYHYRLYAPPGGGTIVKIEVETGQTVRQGELLIMMENISLRKQIDDSRFKLKQVRATIEGKVAALDRIQLKLTDAIENYTRAQHLFQDRLISRVKYENAQLLVEVYRLSLSEQKSLLISIKAQEAGLDKLLKRLTSEEQLLTIKSPIRGVVMNLPVKEGQTLIPGTLLAAITVLAHIEIKADILSDDMAEIKVGQRVTIASRVLKEALTGRVKKIYPQAKEELSPLGVIERRVPVIIALNRADLLKPGFEVNVAIETFKLTDVIVVPKQAVRTTKDMRQKVMVVVDNMVHHRFITTGATDAENLEVVSGLSAGDIVIFDGRLDLTERQRVKSISIAAVTLNE